MPDYQYASRITVPASLGEYKAMTAQPPPDSSDANLMGYMVFKPATGQHQWVPYEIFDQDPSRFYWDEADM